MSISKRTNFQTELFFDTERNWKMQSLDDLPMCHVGPVPTFAFGRFCSWLVGSASESVLYLGHLHFHPGTEERIATKRGCRLPSGPKGLSF